MARDAFFPARRASPAAGHSGSPKFTVLILTTGAAVDLGAGQQGTGLLVVTGKLGDEWQHRFSRYYTCARSGQRIAQRRRQWEKSSLILMANFDPNDASADTFGIPLYVRRRRHFDHCV